MSTVSVVMPCFNHSRYIRESVNSVLRQTHGALELIVVDDCSSDGSWEVIEELAREDSRIRSVRHQHNCGAAKSRNDGLVAARGDFIAFCDADDIWEPDKLTSQIALLERHETHAVTFCDAHIIDSVGCRTGRRFSDLFPPPRVTSGWYFSELVKTNFINTQSVLMRRACVEHSGMFDESLKGASLEDWWYWMRLSREYKFIYSAACLGEYRVHSASSSTSKWRSYSVTRYKVFRRMLNAYSDLPAAVRARAWLSMGVDLCDLGKGRLGRQLLCRAMSSALPNPRAYPIAARAFRQLLVRATK